MHAPDGLFSLTVAAAFACVSFAVVWYACRAVSRRHDPQLVATMGLLAAFIFAAQMINFPIAGGTTGHLLGGTLAAILAGPWAGTVVMAAVILFQAVLGDGGLTAIGPNVFNMGIVGTCGAYAIYRIVAGREPVSARRATAAAFFASWCALPLGALFATFELAASGTASVARTMPAMVGVHMLIGVGEALITASVVAFVARTRPDLMYGRRSPTAPALDRLAMALVLAACVGIAAGLSIVAQRWDAPDGLDSIGERHGFIAESPTFDGDDRLTTLPAYALGVHLVMRDDRVVVDRRYDAMNSPLEPGDSIREIDESPVRSLEDVAAAIGSAAAEAHRPHRMFRVAAERADIPLALETQANDVPMAGSLAPRLALLPDYRMPGLDGVLATAVAGLVGTCVIFALAICAGNALVRTPRPTRVPADPTAPPVPSSTERAP